jgi:hypothetical protein
VAGIEYQRAATITPVDSPWPLLRGDAPAAVPLVAEKRGKARIAVEAGPAEPVDRAVARYQRGAATVADQRIILDGLRQTSRKIYRPYT